MDSFEFSKLLALLSYPLSQTLLLLIVGLLSAIIASARSAVFITVLAAAWLWLCSTALMADWLMGTLEDPYRPKALSVSPEADAILVLGGATRGDTHFSSLGDMNQQSDRLLDAVRMFQA